ncbi:MAG: sigma-70 family RNA polymerase sigma factor [Pseudomonadota bacterium]
MLGAVRKTVSPSPNSAPSPSPEALEMNELLVRIAMTADKEAFGRLYAFFGPRVKGYMMRIGASAEEAEDLAQDAMLKVWRKAKLFDPGKASASTWIFTIARNIRIDALRRASKPGLSGDEPSLLPEEEPQADAVVERRERDERIREAFSTLPEQQHEVVRLHFIEDESHSTIAERLGLPLGTVKSRLRLAFGKIRKELGDLDA